MISHSSSGLLLGSLLLQVVFQELDYDLFDLLDRVGLGKILLQRVMTERNGIAQRLFLFHHDIGKLFSCGFAALAHLTDALCLGK